MRKNSKFGKAYLIACESISPFALRAYRLICGIIPGFDDFVYTSLEKLLKLMSYKGLQVYTTHKNIKLELTLDEAYKFGLLFYGVINAYETKIIERILKKGDVVIDVGAYVDGWYTLFPARLIGANGHVYSFEPHPEFYERLKKNIMLNKLKNITVIKKGVYDKVQKVSFYLEGGCSSIVKEQAESYKKKSTPKITIQTTTIDKFVEERSIKKIDLIKIDVEGIEMNVLRGASKTLQKMHPDLIVEVLDEQLKLGGSSKKRLLLFLKNLGYIPYTFTPSGLSQNTNLPMRAHNFYFTTKKVIST